MKPLSKQEIEKRIKLRFPEESFTLLEYKGLGKPGAVICNTCQQKIIINKFSNFFASSKAYGCKNCHGLWKERDKVLEEIKKYYNILDIQVKETHHYYHIKCKQCGHERITTLNNLKRGILCGCKTNVIRNRSPEEFIETVNENSILGKYELLGNYVNQTTKVLLKHDCGFIWSVRPSDVIHGKSQCPKCMSNQSKMALYIENLLKEAKIPYQAEKRLENSLQRFDFYLEKNELKIAIEYNGLQHYKEVEFFNNSLQTYQQRDEKKRQYCYDNGIILYEIPYTMKKKEIKNKIIEIINKFNDYPAREQDQVVRNSICPNG